MNEQENPDPYKTAKAQLELMLPIVRAVHFAHERRVLHCDLKPKNILFDSSGEPHVSDFGLARPIDAPKASGDEEVRGTRGWMSPEQVRGEEQLTTASDVFALGVMLHWLSTENFPFGNGDDFEARVLAEPPPPLPSWRPELSWGLRAIAHRALQKEPSARYPSAAAFAEDLERLRSHHTIQGRQVPFWGRAWNWSLRHPGARNAIFLLLPCFALLMLLISQAQRDELRRSVLDMNAYAASGQAAAVLYQLREYGEAIERAAADPDVKAITSGPHRAAAPVPGSQTSGNPCSVQTELEDNLPLRRYAEGFSTMVVLDADSCSRARISEEPASLDYIQRRFEWRDYFNGARDDAAKQRRKSYVRKAYRSSVSQLIKFAVSTSLFEGDKWIGVVSGSITAASTLQLPRVKRVETDDRLTALLGPFEGEIDDPSKSDRPEYTLLVHPRLGRGQKVTLPPNRASELDGAFRETPERMDQFELATSLPLQRSDYVDPLLEDRWLAAFAPVGRTGYVVLVQTRDAVAVRPSNGLRQLAVGLIAMSAAILLAWAGFFLWRRQREREALKPLVSRRG